MNYKRELQLKMLEIVKTVDEICRKNEIKYYIIYGSCLGAVRHNGFIPWDDDFDIGMTYNNYLKFINVCKTDLDTSKYFLQSLDTDPNFYLSFIKIRDIHTTLIEEKNKDYNIVNGVCVDIFPIVGVPNGRIKRKIWEINRAFVLSANINVINNKLLFLMFRIVKFLIGKKNIIKICTKQCFKYSCSDNQTWCSLFDGDGVEINSVNRETMGKPTYVDFEDIKLPIPEKYDTYLKHIYNDYMQIPTPEQIKKWEHKPYIIDLNHSYEEYLKINH